MGDSRSTSGGDGVALLSRGRGELRWAELVGAGVGELNDDRNEISEREEMGEAWLDLWGARSVADVGRDAGFGFG